MSDLIDKNSEFFLFLKREYGNKEFSVNELELMFVAYLAGKHGVPPQTPALLSPRATWS